MIKWCWCRGKVTADVLIGELSVGPLLRGGYEEVSRREHKTRDLPRFGPSKGKDLLLLFYYWVSTSRLQGCGIATYASRGSKLSPFVWTKGAGLYRCRVPRSVPNRLLHEMES